MHDKTDCLPPAEAETPGVAALRDAPEVPGSVAWHARRASAIGASEVAALFGLSPFGGPVDVFLAKITPPEHLAARPDTPAQRRGHRLEAYLADEAAARFGWTLATAPGQRHPVHGFLAASPDRLLLDEAGNVAALVEVKTARSRDGWADPQEDPTGCPAHYALQLQHQLLVGVAWKGEHVHPARGYIVASVGSLDDFRVYAFDAHAGVQARIVEVAGAFWRDHVLTRQPPPLDGSAGGDALLRLLYPADTRPELVRVADADPIVADMLALRQARADLEAAEKHEAELAQRVKARIGDSPGITGPGFRATWKSAKPSERTDWQAAAAELQHELASLTSEPAARCVAEAAARRATKTAPGSRRFLPAWT